MPESETVRPATELIDAFRAAQRAFNGHWDEGPMPGIGDADGKRQWDAEHARRNQARIDAAHALVTACAHRHYIEQTARLWLRLGAGGWVLDAVFPDVPLDGEAEGPDSLNCQHADELGKDFDDECDMLIHAGVVLRLPSLDMLAQQIQEIGRD